MNPDQLVHRTRVEVQQRMAGQGAGHGWDHVARVLANARQIHAHVGGDLLVIELAALLHDVGDAKFHEGVERSGEISRQILQQLDASPTLIDHVVHIVDNLSFRKRSVAEPLSPEGMVVQDADRLDALGAVGIVRTVEFGASRGQPFFSTVDEETGVNHFYEKLFKLRDLMNTEIARQMATSREQFMRAFLVQFWQECGGTVNDFLPLRKASSGGGE